MAKKESRKQRCKAKCHSTGEQCKKWAAPGYEVCSVHGAGYKKRVESGERKNPGRPPKHGLYSKRFKREVLDKIEDYRNDETLENLDVEFAYLKSLPERIENLDDKAASEKEKIEMLERILDSVFRNAEKREKVIEHKRYSLGMEKVKLLVQHMFAAVSKHVDDPAILTSIGNELRLLASKTGNVNEVGRLLQNSSDDDTTL